MGAHGTVTLDTGDLVGWLFESALRLVDLV